MKRLEEVKQGERIAIIDGPGQFPREGMCSKSGTARELVTNRWGTHLLVDCDDGTAEAIHGLTTVGIGAYIMTHQESEQ